MPQQYYTVADLVAHLEARVTETNRAESRWPAILGLVSTPEPLQLMLRLRDNRKLEGQLNTVVDGRLSIVNAATGVRNEVLGSDLRGVYQRVPDHGREWTVAAISVPVVVGLLSVTARLMATGHSGAAEGFRTVFYLCLYVGLPALLLHHGTRRGIGRWLTRWAPLYGARDV